MCHSTRRADKRAYVAMPCMRMYDNDMLSCMSLGVYRCAILLDELTFHEAHTRRRSKSTHAGRASPNAARKGHTTGRSATSSSTDRAPAPATFIPQVTWPIHGMNKNVKPSYTYAIDPSTVSVPSVTSLTSSASTTSTTGSVDPPGSASLDGAGRRKTPQAGGAESGTDASVSGVRVSTAVQSGNTVSTNTATTASNSATNTGAVASVGSASSSSNGFAGLEPVGAHGANGVGLTQGSGSSTNVTGISNGTVIDTSSTSVSGTSSGANGGVGKASVSAGMAQGTTGQQGWYIRFMPLGPPAPQGTDGGSGGDAAAQQPAGAATPAAAVFGQAGEGAVSDGEMSDGGFSSFCANVSTPHTHTHTHTRVTCVVPDMCLRMWMVLEFRYPRALLHLCVCVHVCACVCVCVTGCVCD